MNKNNRPNIVHHGMCLSVDCWNPDSGIRDVSQKIICIKWLAIIGASIHRFSTFSTMSFCPHVEYIRRAVLSQSFQAFKNHVRQVQIRRKYHYRQNGFTERCSNSYEILDFIFRFDDEIKEYFETVVLSYKWIFRPWHCNSQLQSISMKYHMVIKFTWPNFYKQLIPLPPRTKIFSTLELFLLLRQVRPKLPSTVWRREDTGKLSKGLMLLTVPSPLIASASKFSHKVLILQSPWKT